MNENKFSYKDYIDLLNCIKKTGTLKDYTEVLKDSESPFIILRHDIEFSPQRALDLALIEHKEGIKSTYFVQVSNNAYNVLSSKNIERLKKILSLGHNIGLHFHLQNSNNLEEIRKRIVFECDLLSNILGVKVDRFSFHRPSNMVLENNIKIPGLINAYDPMFFTFTNNVDNIDFKSSVKYIADSRNEWSYTSPWNKPCEELFNACPKIQLLCHPYSWSNEGISVLENLKDIINENKEEFINTLNNETKYVQKYLPEL